MHYGTGIHCPLSPFLLIINLAVTTDQELAKAVNTKEEMQIFKEYPEYLPADAEVTSNQKRFIFTIVKAVH